MREKRANIYRLKKFFKILSLDIFKSDLKISYNIIPYEYSVFLNSEKSSRFCQ